ncbi:sensor histidine kinase [Microbacterium sp.]|uniref:sensor histidine kinase n=1 Tax=Microbacterium sp. TaxID=51671 RepID=UPI0027369C09|nr:histidine kinase [Microbacterium sp.]MDP3950712.1 histidine kinase [Microbacterium sp.]
MDTISDPRAPRRRDVVLTIVLIALTVAEGALRRDLPWPWVTVGVTVVLLAGLPWRRRHPLILVLAMGFVTMGFAIIQAVAGVAQAGLGVMFALLLVPYALFRWGTLVDRVIGSVVLGTGVLTSAALVSGPFADRIIGAIAGILFVGTACLFGALYRERASSRERQIAIARAQEREALARDLHDTVAHHVSAIAIRAQVASADGADGQQVAASLAVIEKEASAALSEMRSLVRTLREPAEYSPARGLADIAAIATDGPPLVTVRVDVASGLSDLVAMTLYRVTQEAVTNARRHAVGVRRIDVDLRTENGDVVLTVTDDGAPAASAGDGYGLRGMAERLAMLGGELEAGPNGAGGWSLRARVPGSTA